MAKLTAAREGDLYERIAAILEHARSCRADRRHCDGQRLLAHRSRNRAGRPSGERPRGYQDRVIDELAKKLTKQFGKGFSARSLRRMRQFFLAYPEGSQLPSELGGAERRSKSAVGPIRVAGFSKRK